MLCSIAIHCKSTKSKSTKTVNNIMQTKRFDSEMLSIGYGAVQMTEQNWFTESCEEDSRNKKTTN